MKSLFNIMLVILTGTTTSLLACSKTEPEYTDNKEVLKNDLNTHKETPTGKLVATIAELNKAIKEAVAGDIIIMKDGVWKDVTIIVKGTGTKEKPITLQAQSPGGVIISGKSSLQLSGEYLVIDGLHFKDGYSPTGSLIKFNSAGVPANYSRITNIVISEFNRPREDGSDVWISLFGKNNSVDHSFFHGKTSNSVLLIVWRPTAEANYHNIHHNYFKDIPSIGLGGATAIRIGDGVQALSASHTTVEANIFENMLGIGKIVSMKSGGNFIKNNTFINASGSICIRQGNGNLIEGNYILPAENPSYTGGILVIGENHIIRHNYIQGTRARGKAAIVLYEGEPNNHPGKGGYYPTKNIMIANNTLVDNDKNILIGQYYNPNSDMNVPVENITYKNNVIIGNKNSTPIIQVLDKPVGTINYEGNIFFNGNLSGLENIKGISITDPKLLVSKDGMYHYSASNPLKNNIVAKPLKRSEVGPEWIKTKWEELGIKDKPYITN